MHFYYRLFFKLNNKEYSYVGTSINIQRRKQDHFLNLRKVLNLNLDDNLLARTFFEKVIQENNLPMQKALYYKLALFMLKNDLSIEDLNFEQLSVPEQFIQNNNFSYQEIERFLIKKYHGFKFGFNGLLANIFIKEENIKKIFLPNDLKIACEIINLHYSKEYLNLFWWSYLTIPIVILTLQNLNLNLAKKHLQKIKLFNSQNLDFINEQILFYRVKYQRSKILYQVSI